MTKDLKFFGDTIGDMSESITERGWFSYRYAVPGFIFILFIFLTNLDTIVYILVKSPGTLDLSAFVAILAFLSGPAVGFIVTQIWYFAFGVEIRERSLRRQFYRSDVREKLEKRIVRRKRWVADVDYWALEEIGKRKPGLFNYVTRRWDLFHVLVSTAITMIISWAVGFFLVRGLPLKELFTGSCSSQLDNILIGNLNKYIDVVQIRIFLIVLFSAAILFSSAWWIIRKENQDMIPRILEARCEYCDHLMFMTSWICPNCGAPHSNSAGLDIK